MNPEPLTKIFVDLIKDSDTTSWLKICSMWEDISKEQRITVLRRYKDIVDWAAVSRIMHTFDEDIIREFKDYIVWPAIDNTMRFSLDFIREFRDRLDLEHRRIKLDYMHEFQGTRYFIYEL